ncbi:hypothetical protein SAMN05192533_103213 [Mesobacillus persicus]|uniref:Uncharacterized protein n=1 Tax=Mesobacillus persicus TaxID=930146 RepID=A0A1H7Z0I1_9BACI|nr:hypothetical protein [Mesobacillus persicus]SEM51705.1 hypothetical protein SAMN05192533_103213 [Mesobacillus persicus]
MKRFVFYWRILFFTLLFILYLADVINEFIFFSVISGIIVFIGIPWVFNKVRVR